MRVLIDTNVLLDYLLLREPFEKDAQQVIVACKEGKVAGCIAAHSVTDSFYILRKAYSVDERKRLLMALLEIFEVEGIEKDTLISALENNKFTDFEDCLQVECAKNYDADFIVTRNPKDFSYSPIRCISAEEFVELIK